MKLPLACQFAPLFLLYSYVPYPPVGELIVIVPLVAPLQVTSVEAIAAPKTAGWVIVTLVVTLQTELSSTAVIV